MTAGKIGLDGLAASEEFLDAVMKKYHFAVEDRPSFLAVGKAAAAAARREGGFWCAKYRGEPDTLAVGMTLGGGVDALQDDYAQKGLLLECYMAETVAGELLSEAYRQFNRWVEEQGGLHVARYRFFGAQEEDTLEKMPEVLDTLPGAEVSCNQAYCLSPKKSVVFLACLTGREDVRCQGVCAGCMRADCLNRSRTEERTERKLRWPDLGEAVLPYGYARILGGQEGRDAVCSRR